MRTGAFPLCKYSGCGNDFFLIDNRERFFFPDPPLIQELCAQQADGVILLENSSLSDFRMRIFNADGSEAEMCGNGVRCLMQFIRDLHPEKFHCSIETLAGVVIAMADVQGIKVKMPTPVGFNFNLKIDQWVCHFVNTGVPHTVIFVDDLEQNSWMEAAPLIRHHLNFAPKGTNVNFAQLHQDGIAVRTYERGVEGETLACGTGATAAALIAARLYNLPSPIRVIPRSQDPLFVEFDPTFSSVALIGPAHRI